MSQTPVLEFRNVLKQYPGADGVPFTAVDLDTLTLPQGAFAAVIGPSGSGKTTMLNLASGLDRPDRGEIRVGGHLISKLSQAELCLFRRGHVGFVFQSYNLFPVLSAVENVEFTSLIRGDDPKLARARATKALETVGLAARMHSRPGQLSGGQQQRVAVARALATEPEIIFADEPTANLDSKTALALIELFEELNRRFGTTFLFSTHDHALVQRVRTRIEMRDGRLASTS
jgi:putative ABC transport system ATP-binding protein